MVETDEVKKTVHREMCKVMKEVPAFIPGFPFEGLVGNDNVAEQLIALTNLVTGSRESALANAADGYLDAMYLS